MRCAVGIVTYHPSISRLKENVNSVIEETEKIFIADNGSSNIAEIRLIADADKRIRLIELGENMGIATALNALCRAAEQEGYGWLLTLDEDSVMAEGFLSRYDDLQGHDEAGIICCRVEDRNYGRMYNSPDNGWEYIERTITSGSMMRLSAWRACGGFDEKLFIDGVDFDYCMTLKEHGYRIMRTNDTYILHEVGHGRHTRLFGHNALVMNHSRVRLYYIARNYLYIGHKHNCIRHWRREVLKRILVVLLYEDCKCAKIKSMLSGIRDYRHGIMGKNNTI